MSSFNLTIEGLDELQKDVASGASQLGDAVRWAMVQSVNAVKNTAQELAPYKTGTLRRSIFTEIFNSGFTGTVNQDSSIAPYGIFLEQGTAAHEIVPVNRKALYWQGAFSPVKRVMHPGFAARPFMQPAIEENIETVKGYFNEAMKRIVDIMAGK